MDAVESANAPGDSALATLSCIDGDTVWAPLTVLWDTGAGRRSHPRVRLAEGGGRRIRPADRFGTLYRTMRRGCAHDY